MWSFHPKGLELFVAEHPELAATMILVSVIVHLLTAVFYATLKLRESRLSALLIKQINCTQQAELRSLNKSYAFADARIIMHSALEAISTIVESCYGLVPSGSEVEHNLWAIHRHTDGYMEILSKILSPESMKANSNALNEIEFNLVKLLQDVVDYYHPKAMIKGVELVLDPCDGSVSKLANVRGDDIRLMLILRNLVGNAFKFTPRGSITIRAWAKRPTSILVSHHNWFWRIFLKDHDYKIPQQNPSCMEYIFEVEDTGQGIPIGERKSLFEDSVQIKGFYNLGLGLVQSLVRLMGGDIGIVGKKPAGTCFRFNIFLQPCKQQSGTGNGNRVKDADIEAPA